MSLLVDYFPLTELPVEVQLVILGSLSAQELVRVSGTCKDLFGLCQHNGVWKRVCKRTWNLRPSSAIARPQRWKHYHSQRLTLIREGALKWNTVTPTGATMSKRYQHTGSVVGKDLYFIGGQELAEKRFDDIFVLNTESMSIRKVAPASGSVPRFARHSAVTFGDKIYMFGGYDGVSQHFYLSCYDTVSNSWSFPTTSGPSPQSRTNHSAVAIGSKMYMFGGMYKDAPDRLVFLNDMFCLDMTDGQLKWTRLPQTGDVPAPRCGHRLLAFGNRLVLFGGGCGEQWDRKFSDVHVFDISTNRWSKPKINGSAPVCTFTVAFGVGTFMFVFGGQSVYDNSLTNDLYVLDTVSLEWKKLQAANTYPSSRDMASGNVVDCNMFMFGGYCGAAIDSWWNLQLDPVLVDTHSMPPYA